MHLFQLTLFYYPSMHLFQLTLVLLTLNIFYVISHITEYAISKKYFRNN
jgi:hypothetical protein